MNDQARPFDAERRLILASALKLAVFEGFTPSMMKQAALDAGVDEAAAAAAYPGGAVDLVAFWSAAADRAAAAALGCDAAKALKIREKVALGITARLDYLRPYKEAARRAAAFLALPHNVGAGIRLSWNTADAIWRALGDASTDYNFYSKRTILSGVWATTFARWLGDDSEDEEATKAFLNARINNVMQFEKLKAKMRNTGLDPVDVFGWLAKQRYPLER